MNCQSCKEHLYLYLAGESTDSIRDQVQKHLVECGDCAQRAGHSKQLFTRLDAEIKNPARWEETLKLAEGQNRIIARLDQKTAKPSIVRRFLIPVAAASVLLIAVAVWLMVNQPGVVHIVAGQVKVSDGHIITDADQRGTVRIFNRSQVELAPETELVVKSEKEHIVQMIHGSATFQVEKETKQFIVKTDCAEIQVVGTKFIVTVQATEKGEEKMKTLMTVVVLAGMVQVGNAKGTVTAKASEMVCVEQDKEPQKQPKQDLPKIELYIELSAGLFGLQSAWALTCEKDSHKGKAYHKKIRELKEEVNKEYQGEVDRKQITEFFESLKKQEVFKFGQHGKFCGLRGCNGPTHYTVKIFGGDKENSFECFSCRSNDIEEYAKREKIVQFMIAFVEEYAKQEQSIACNSCVKRFQEKKESFEHTMSCHFASGKCASCGEKPRGICKKEHSPIDAKYCLACAKKEGVCPICGEKLRQDKISDEDKKWIKPGTCHPNSGCCGRREDHKAGPEAPCPRCGKGTWVGHLCPDCGEKLGVCCHCWRKVESK